MRLAQIWRYPVKSIGGEALERVTLTAGERLPQDRRWAVLHAGALHHLEGGRLLKWLPKSACLNGAAAPDLQAVCSAWDGARLVLSHPSQPDLTLDPEAPDHAALTAWLAPLWASSGRPAPARLVSGPVPLTDVKQPFISLLSLDSLEDLEARLGRGLGTFRWRGNFWIEGAEAHAERDWRLHKVRIGGAVLKVRERIARCPATSADPATGTRDGDMPADLMRLFDRDDFGLYLDVIEGGEVAVGDPVELL